MSEHHTFSLDKETTEWRAEQKQLFSKALENMVKKLKTLFQEDTADIEIEEWTSEVIATFYVLHARIVIPSKLRRFNITWNPERRIVDRNITILQSTLTGKGLGTQINEISESMARDLDAKTFKISAIVEPRWYETLLSQGYKRDPKDTSTVYRDLK